jgi:archaetidylinositol phosphate synthase
MLDAILGASPALKRIQSRAARILSAAGLSADAATVAGVIIGVCSGIAFFVRALWLGVALLAVSAALDAFDGTIARECGGAPTLFGGVLDLTSDRIVEAAVILGIAAPRPELHFPALLLVASWYVNITVFLAVGAAMERRGPKIIDYPPGILERTEALIFFAVLALIRPIGPLLCYVFTALEIVTGAQRFLFGRRMLRG